MLPRFFTGFGLVFTVVLICTFKKIFFCGGCVCVCVGGGGVEGVTINCQYDISYQMKCLENKVSLVILLLLRGENEF